MSGRRIFALARRIAEQFRRDRPTLGLVFVAPIVVLALLGWVFSDQHVPTTRLAHYSAKAVAECTPETPPPPAPAQSQTKPC